MDLTSDALDDVPLRNERVRVRARHYDDEESENLSQEPSVKKAELDLQPAAKLRMCMRYDIFWTEVRKGFSNHTYSITLDVAPHLLVIEVTDMALRSFTTILGPRASVLGFSLLSSAWELRFASSVGLPRYDYPCMVGFNGSFRASTGA